MQPASDRPRVSGARPVELWWALAIGAAVGGVYLLLVRVADIDPHSSGLLGHGFGVIGFILMLMTETLYSLRKRSRLARWGRPANWLRFHIVTGLVGPFMVLLHAAWRYNGLAGLVMLMTSVVVLSGFIGRYIYTRIPRSADGRLLDAAELQVQVALRRALGVWTSVHIPLGVALFTAAFIHIGAALYYATLLR